MPVCGCDKSLGSRGGGHQRTWKEIEGETEGLILIYETANFGLLRHAVSVV
jgi:hypothetical protein